MFSIRVETQMYKSYLFGSKSLLLIIEHVAHVGLGKDYFNLGDSISAGYGIDPKQGWVQLLQKRLDQQYPKQHKVVNASMSGETTSGALARLPKLLQTYKPEVVVIELGGNDGLRGQPPQMIQQNLSQLVQLSQKQKAQVILFGMKIPPNYGTAYSKAFENNYKTVSQKYQVKLLPFFLDGVAGQKQLMQNDLIHPNAQAQQNYLIWLIHT